MKIYCSGKYKPQYKTEGAAGLDLCNNTKSDAPIEIKENEIVDVDTQVHVEIPNGYVGILAVRSSLGFKGLDLINSIGVIDSDYRGAIGLRFINRAKDTITIKPGERVAQLLVVPYIKGTKHVDTLEELSNTKRGKNGFGSTGRF